MKGKINEKTGKAFRSKGSCDVMKMKWVSDNGSIFTEDEVESKGDAGVFVVGRIAIAFNVTDKVANHIVKLHNSALIHM